MELQLLLLKQSLIQLPQRLHLMHLLELATHLPDGQLMQMAQELVTPMANQ